MARFIVPNPIKNGTLNRALPPNQFNAKRPAPTKNVTHGTIYRAKSHQNGTFNRALQLTFPARQGQQRRAGFQPAGFTMKNGGLEAHPPYEKWHGKPCRASKPIRRKTGRHKARPYNKPGRTVFCGQNELTSLRSPMIISVIYGCNRMVRESMSLL
jgi:hypothetical protein